MRSEILRELLSEYEQQRADNAMEERRRADEIEKKCPELAQLAQERQNIIFAGMRGILNGSSSAEELPARMEALNKRVSALLTENGYPADYLSPVYHCAKCRDTGYVGEPVREMCDCLRQRLNARLYREVGLEEAQTQTFATFDAGIFSDAALPDSRYSQRMITVGIRQWAEKWCRQYPEISQKTVVLMGKSGLGKTFMLHAMAHALLDQGANVLVISAYRLMDIARKAYFGNQGSDLDAIMAAEVLMVDDMGTEPVYDVTLAQWFNLVNERQSRGMVTVVSTNLSESELRQRYTERIASRLLDHQQAKLLQFLGEDVRRR